MTQWADVVDEIRGGNEEAEEGLYSAVSECARLRLVHCVDPQTVDDHVQEILMVVLAAIRNGELRDPSCLMGFVRTVTRRQVSVHIRRAIHRRRTMVPVNSTIVAAPPEESPEARIACRQKTAAIGDVLGKLRARDREILVRFYYEEQDSDHICQEMRLTRTQFRLYKSRALAKCCELADRRSSAKLQSTRPLRIA